MIKEHKKCKVKNKTALCSFCLIRSVVMKSRWSVGRSIIKPVEALCHLPQNIYAEGIIEDINLFLHEMCEIM